jgi:hypothetical protein
LQALVEAPLYLFVVLVYSLPYSSVSFSSRLFQSLLLCIIGQKW